MSLSSKALAKPFMGNYWLLIAALPFLFAFSRPPFWSSSSVRHGLPFKPLFDATELQYDIPNNLLAKIGWRESRFNPAIVEGRVISPKGAVGIMQILPDAHPTANPYNPHDAVPYAGKYLRSLFNKYGDWRLAVMAYNWGPGNVDNWRKNGGNIPAETQSYISEVF